MAPPVTVGRFGCGRHRAGIFSPQESQGMLLLSQSFCSVFLAPILFLSTVDGCETQGSVIKMLYESLYGNGYIASQCPMATKRERKHKERKLIHRLMNFLIRI